MRFTILETFDNYIDANLTLGRLEAAGIQCWLQDENTATINPIFANAIGGIKLVVQEADLPQAREVLHALKQASKENFACPYCNSHNIERITTNRKVTNVISSIVTWLLGSYAMGVHQVWRCFDCGKEFDTPADLRPQDAG